MLKRMSETQLRFTNRLMAHHEQFLFVYVGYIIKDKFRCKWGEDAPSKRRLAKKFYNRCVNNIKSPDVWTINLILEWYGLEYEVRFGEPGKLKIYSKGDGTEV